MKKVLILTASFGEGHNTAARNVRDAIEQLNDEAVVEVLDLFALTYGRLHDFVCKLHLQVVQRTPRIWAEIYNWVDRSSTVDARFGIMARLRDALRDILEEYQPDCLISTYPLYAHVIQEIYRDHSERPFRFITIVTDSISVNSLWYRAKSDYFCVANDATAKVLIKGGVPAEKVYACGFPVSPQFADQNLPELQDLTQDGAIRILYIINCGKRRAGVLLDRLLDIPNAQLTITVGKDPELKAELVQRAEEHLDRVTVLGWTNQMPELMRSHHFVISKAGGATVQEAIAARCPMIVNQVIPGQEEGNAALLSQFDIGSVAEGAKEVVSLIERATAANGFLWKRWRANLKKIARPDAAFRIAELALEGSEPSSSSSLAIKVFSGKATPLREMRPPGIFRERSRMLLCDFHIHSNYSDGSLTVPDLIDFYGNMGFDCICITDHLADPGRLMGKLARLTNFTLSPGQLDEYFEVIERERKRAWRRYGMLVLTGIEFNKDGLTKKSSAHLLGVDLVKPINPALPLPETIDQIHEQGGIAIASHPHIMKSEWGKNTLYLWENQEIFAPLIDAWEIANRQNIFTPVGLKNLRFVANSDFHKPKHIYSWKTLLHCEKDPAAIKECIKLNKEVAITFFRKEQAQVSEQPKSTVTANHLLTPIPVAAAT
ncbi:MAG: MGDG synthase family glycosyltransferase [Limisphaerales bacterium]